MLRKFILKVFVKVSDNSCIKVLASALFSSRLKKKYHDAIFL